MFGHNDSDDSRPTLMQTTPGFTSKRFCQNPLGTEGELTPGADDQNPYRSADEREEVERVARKERQQRQGDLQLFKTSTKRAEDTGGISHPMHTNSTVDDPTEGNDPFVFDDLGGFELPGLDSASPFNDDGPRF
jgi:hypothetical protein